MSTQVIVSEEAIRELVREVLANKSLGSVLVSEHESDEEMMPVVNVSNVVDPSAALTDPDNPNYKPNNSVELQVAVKALSDDLPTEKVPEVYDTLVGAIKVSKEKEDSKVEEKMKNKNVDTKTESAIRLAIRKHLQEAGNLTQAYPPPKRFSKKPKNFGPVVGPMPPVQKIPAGVHGGEYNRKVDKYKGDLQKILREPNSAIDDFGGGADEGDALPATHSKNTMMTDVSGASFQDIAKELGFSVAGAKQAVDKALLKAQWAADMQDKNPEDMEIIVLTSMNDYIKVLSKTGELSSADIQLMKDHPDIVRELDGFREFLDRAVRKARKPDGIENPLGESKKKKKTLRENSEGSLVSLDEMSAALSEWEHSGSSTDLSSFLDYTFDEREFSKEAIEFAYEHFPEEMAAAEGDHSDAPRSDASLDVVDCPVCHGDNTHLNAKTNEIECKDCDDSFPVVEHVSKVKKESRTIRKGNLKIVLEKAGDSASKKCKFCNQDVKVATTTAGEYFDEHKKSDGSDCHGSKSRTAAAAVSEGKGGTYRPKTLNRVNEVNEPHKKIKFVITFRNFNKDASKIKNDIDDITQGIRPYVDRLARMTRLNVALKVTPNCEFQYTYEGPGSDGIEAFVTEKFKELRRGYHDDVSDQFSIEISKFETLSENTKRKLKCLTGNISPNEN